MFSTVVMLWTTLRLNTVRQFVLSHFEHAPWKTNVRLHLEKKTTLRTNTTKPSKNTMNKSNPYFRNPQLLFSPNPLRFFGTNNQSSPTSRASAGVRSGLRSSTNCKTSFHRGELTQQRFQWYILRAYRRFRYCWWFRNPACTSWSW